MSNLTHSQLRTLDAWIAEKVMGWQWGTFLGKSYLIRGDVAEFVISPGSFWGHGKHGPWDSEHSQMPNLYPPIPHYSTSLDLMAAVEEKVIEKVGRERWVACLYWQLWDTHHVSIGDFIAQDPKFGIQNVAAMACATPAQRALACVLAMGGDIEEILGEGSGKSISVVGSRSEAIAKAFIAVMEEG